MAKGIDLANPNSSLHLGWNEKHMLYNELIDSKAYELDLLYKENNWEQSKVQEEIRRLQGNVKKI